MYLFKIMYIICTRNDSLTTVSHIKARHLNTMFSAYENVSISYCE